MSQAGKKEARATSDRSRIFGRHSHAPASCGHHLVSAMRCCACTTCSFVCPTCAKYTPQKTSKFTQNSLVICLVPMRQNQRRGPESPFLAERKRQGHHNARLGPANLPVSPAKLSHEYWRVYSHAVSGVMVRDLQKGNPQPTKREPRGAKSSCYCSLYSPQYGRHQVRGSARVACGWAPAAGENRRFLNTETSSHFMASVSQQQQYSVLSRHYSSPAPLRFQQTTPSLVVRAAPVCCEKFHSARLL